MTTKEIEVPFDINFPASTTIRAGDLVMLYEEGNLRYIRHGNTEIIRMIYPAIRDDHWQSAPYELQDEKVELSAGAFRITYTAVYRLQMVHYKAICTIEGKQDNTIIFTFAGEALSSFLRNRIGLCVLHPVNEYKGRKVLITGPDGLLRHSSFPELVSPHQPFLNIREMQSETKNGLKGTLTFEGDIFETEDQRNWADSSFKTYSTPLELPYPVEVNPGQRMQQRVTLNVSQGTLVVPGRNSIIPETKTHFPAIGFSLPYMDEKAMAEITSLKKIHFHHCRIEVRLDKKSWQQDFSQSSSRASQIGTQMELIVFFEKGDDDELKGLVAEIEKAQGPLFSMLVLQNGHRVTPATLMKKVYPIIKERSPSVRVGYGTDGNFAELNRNRPTDFPFDFVHFTINPQVHNSDISTIIENLANQPDALETTKAFAHGTAIHISLQFCNNADQRQYTAFAALWTLISIQNVSEADLITLDGSFIQDPRPSTLYDLLLKIAEFRPEWIIRRYEDEKLLVDGLMLENANGERIFFTGLPETYR